jgi:outer membrane protein assembly factor BamB
MNFRVFVLLSACVLCGAVAPFQAQNAAASPTPADAYLPLKKCWEFAVENISQSTVAASNGTVYVAENDGRIRALNTKNGSVIWSTELGGKAAAMIAVPKIGIAVITTRATGTGNTSTLRMLSSDSGLVRYSKPVSAGEGVNLYAAGSRLITADANGAIAAYDAQTGELAWQLNMPAKLSARPAVSDESIVVGTEDKAISVIGLGSGKVSFSIPTERAITSLAVRENGMIVAGDDRGNVTNYRDTSGSIWWKFKSGARIGTIIETSDGVLVGSFDNFVYMLSKYNGDVKWKRRLDGRIVSAPTVFDGYLLVASSTEENAQVLDLDNGKTVDQIQFGENKFVLASPFVSENNFAVFTLVNTIATFSQSECPAK